MLAVILAMALAVLDTGAFLGAALTTGLLAFAGVFVLEVVVAALGAAFFAVAILSIPIFIPHTEFVQGPYCRKNQRAKECRAFAVIGLKGAMPQ